MRELRFDEVLYFRERGYTEYTKCEIIIMNDVSVTIRHKRRRDICGRRSISMKTLARNEVFTKQEMIDTGRSIYLI